VPLSSYLFKHALVQEAAYGTLLRARRQELHARVAAVLEQHFADLVERQPELLAHHLTAADDTERAAGQWLRAGRHAAARSAHLEAIRYFDRGFAILPSLPEGPARDGQEIELQLAKGLSLLTTESFMSTAAAHAYTRARELAERLDDTAPLFTAVYGLWQSTVASGMVVGASGLSDRLLRLTEGNADDGLRLQAHHSAWSTSTFAGEPAVARDHCEAGRRLYDPERHRSHRLLYGGHDPGVCAGCFGAQVDWLLGYPERGLALSRAALALAKRIAHPFSLLEALLFNAMLHLDRGEPEMALQRLDAAEALAAEQRLSFALEPRLLRGAALIAQGAFADAVTYLRQGHEAGRVNQSRPLGFALLAAVMVQQAEHAAALAMVRDGLRVQQETGHGLWDAELHRFEGIALFGLSRLEEGQVALEEALCVARRQQARAYELRAATSLARLWRDQGKPQQARDLLAPVYGWFTEGFDTRDLKEAKALLEQLAA
jgi:predicted ATPase